MAVTSGKKKARLDYSALINEAISSDETAVTDTAAVEETEKIPPKKQANDINRIQTVEKVPKTGQGKAVKAKDKDRLPDASDPLDAKFSEKQKGRGVQKSVYLDEDVHRYIQSKCDKYNIKYSQVLNEILREAIKPYKN